MAGYFPRSQSRLGTPFHIKYAPKSMPEEAVEPSPEQAKFQELLRELFQFDCADLDFGIYRIMNHKRKVIDRYIDQELPAAIEEAVDKGAIATEAERARVFEETRAQMIEFFGENTIAPDGRLLKYDETPIGKKYMLWHARARNSESTEGVRRDIYNHLYSFFSRYYQDGDFIPKRRYSWEHPYVVPYNGEEVHFHWANRDQYYVKAAEQFRDYVYRTGSGVSVRFVLTSADVEQNDVKGQKRFFIPVLSDVQWSDQRRALELPFEYRPLTPNEVKEFGRNGQQEAIIDQAEATIAESLASMPQAVKALLDPRQHGDGEEAAYFAYHARRFTRRRTSDFFIHRNLDGFLSRELEFYLKSEVLKLGPFSAGSEERADAWLDKMRIIREVGRNVIAFLAQIEGFQKMLWEKRKFVVDPQYCIAVGLVPDELVQSVMECAAQWKEWRNLGCIGAAAPLFAGVENPAARREFLKAHPGLLLDTRHFYPKFVDDLLGAFANVESVTDGIVIQSENWQALNLLEERYRERLKSVYIDPPYNTAASAIIYKNEYKDSSWLSLMADRISVSRKLLEPTGILSCAIDDEEVSRLRIVLQDLLPREIGTVVVRSNPAGRKSRGQLSPSHEFALFLGNESAAPGSLPKTKREEQRYRFVDDVGRFDWNNLIRHGSNDRREDSPRLFFPIFVNNNEQIRIPELKWIAEERCYHALEAQADDEVEVYPVRRYGNEIIEKNWHHGPERMRANPEDYRVRRSAGEISIDFKIRMDQKATPKTWWADARYASANRGARMLKDLFVQKPFDFPKAVGLVEDCLRVCGLGDASCVLDFFAGSGTTGHAVINLNREDGGRRKFILVEMGDHFDTVLLPRLKKVAFSPNWKEGKPKRPANADEAERGPRIIKYFRMEGYEDALNNIQFERQDESLFGLEDYLLGYMLQWETKRSATLLNVSALERPFDYKLRLNGNGQGVVMPVDLPETFNYLLGLAVSTRRVFYDESRRYLVYTGSTREGRNAVVIWRNTADWTLKDRTRDRDFVVSNKLAEGADEIWMNGDSIVEGAKPLDNLFKERMFASVSERKLELSAD